MRSRLGGLPSLPDAVEWPSGRSYDGKKVPLHFFAQIDCAELPKINTGMPTEGLLFFFGRDDEEQLWGDTRPHDDARVIYAPKVSPDQRERPAPAALPPIRGEYYRGAPRPLPGESGPSIHASWPVSLLLIDTWPDLSAILETDLLRNAVLSCRPYFEQKGRIKKVPEKDPWAAAIEFDRAREPFGELYDQRLNELRVGAIFSATGRKPRADENPNWWSGLNEPSRLPFDPGPNSELFPQVALMIDRIARLIVLKASSLLAHRDYQDQEKREPLARTKEAGLYWVNRCREMGLETIPPQADILGFTDWLKQVGAPFVSEGGPRVYSPYLRNLNDIFSEAILSTIQYAARSPRVAALIPPYFYQVFENQHLPFDQAFSRMKKGILRPAFHQMLGHERSCQDAKPVDSDAVLLLQLCPDDVLNMSFGDRGFVSFWIEPKDLSHLRFENARGEIVGH